MKISAVCEQTGLTDRTVRFYTEEGLLNPSFTKNYLGRKTFDFSDADVAMLKNIAVLRKYGFAIPEIKSILEDPAQSVAIIESLRQKKQETIHSEQELLDALLALEQGRAYTVPELAEALTNPRVEATKPIDEPLGCLDLLTELFTRFFWIVAVPTILMAVLYLRVLILTYFGDKLVRVPPAEQFYPILFRDIFRSLLPLAVAAAMLMVSGVWFRKRPGLRCFLVGVLTLCIGPASVSGLLISVFAPDYAYLETNDPVYYMQISDIRENEEDIIRLFPDQIPDYAVPEHGGPYPETTRYYYYQDGEIFWERYEVFAQWAVSPEVLEQEKRRIQEEFADNITLGELGAWEYWSMEMDPAERMAKPEYHYLNGGYNLYLFVAWNEEQGLIRYVAASSDDLSVKPAFLSMDWN